MKNELKQRHRNNHLATSAHFYILLLRICVSCGAERPKPQTLRRFAPDKGYPLRCLWQLSHNNTTTVTLFRVTVVFTLEE